MEWPDSLNIATWFLDARIDEGKGERVALLAGDSRITYREVQSHANQFANVLSGLGVPDEHSGFEKEIKFQSVRLNTEGRVDASAGYAHLNGKARPGPHREIFKRP